VRNWEKIMSNYFTRLCELNAAVPVDYEASWETLRKQDEALEPFRKLDKELGDLIQGRIDQWREGLISAHDLMMGLTDLYFGHQTSQSFCDQLQEQNDRDRAIRKAKIANRMGYDAYITNEEKDGCFKWRVVVGQLN